MRIYFFGDIHGNGYALEACLDYMSENNADQAYCLGDLVGWLPFGNRSLARVRSLNLPTIAGNHDLLVAGVITDHPGQLDRMQATAYNAGLLSTAPEAIAYLQSLPLMIEREDFVAVHHSPFHLPKPGEAATIECFNYLDEAELAGCLDAWRSFSKRIIFSGHDHDPAVFELPDNPEPITIQGVKVYKPESGPSFTVCLNSQSRYWVKAGSVGGPYRDGVPAANCVLYDSSAETITLLRIPYETEALRQELGSHFFARNLPTLQRYVALLDSKC
jgi:predicted phosphodiesterase